MHYNILQENWLFICLDKGAADMAKKRANLYSKYVPLIAQFATELAGKKKEPNYNQLIRMGSEIEEQV